MEKLLFFGKIIAFFSVIIILACSKITEKQARPPYNKDDKKDSGYVLSSNQAIIEAGDKMEWAFGKNYKKCTPSETDNQSAEKLIIQCFYDQKRGTANRLLNRKPEDYCRQFVGAINEKDEKIIWVNCFCRSQIDSFKEWKSEIIYVADGGNCFFNLKINIDKNEYYDVIVNGNA